MRVPPPADRGMGGFEQKDADSRKAAPACRARDVEVFKVAEQQFAIRCRQQY
jgi:hypothetical protein